MCTDKDTSRYEDEEERYVLTPWGCLYGTLLEYNIDLDYVSGTVGNHIVEDFMDAMMRAGYVVNGEGVAGA